MLEWAKVIHEAIGIEFPRLFMVTFALFGMLTFGCAGWLVDQSYRVKLRDETTKAANVPTPAIASNALQGPNKAKPTPRTTNKPQTSIEQHSTGAQSPNLVSGDNSNIEINGQKE